MDQKLFKQIKNEWRSNVWLAIELLVVSVVLWYIVDYMYVQISVYNEPLGFDTEHCYKIYIAELNEKSPDFIRDATDDDRRKWNDEIEDRLRRRPEIEAVGRGMNAHPYNGSDSGVFLEYDTLSTSGHVISRSISPDFIRVFRYTGINGETPDQLAEILERGDIIISDNLFYDKSDIKGSSLLGKDVYLDHDSTRTWHVGAVIHPVRYTDFAQGQSNRTVLVNTNYYHFFGANEWVVRVRADMDKDFEENLRRDMEKYSRIGNLYMYNVVPFSAIRNQFLMGDFNEIRNMSVGMAFLLLNIFLGLFGTFWFRTQQRVKDIAVRKVSGATSADILRLLIGEGLLILTIVTVPAVIADLNLAHLELNSYYGGYIEWGRLALTAAIAYLLMALMIVAGVAIPAVRAMHITPAIALHDE